MSPNLFIIFMNWSGLQLSMKHLPVLTDGNLLILVFFTSEVRVEQSQSSDQKNIQKIQAIGMKVFCRLSELLPNERAPS